jgi:hypothetical protein
MSRLVYLIFCCAVFTLNCVKYVTYIPDPEKDIEMWVENLVRQRSFRYAFQLKTQAVFSSAQGECIIGRGEHVKGAWYSADSQVPYEYYGFGDIEYGRDNGTWRTMARGDESDILAQVTRLLEFRTFEYRGSDVSYDFAFKANIPFLVPGRWKDMVGTMKVSQRHYLPVHIWAGLPDSSVYWSIELFDYNRPKNIHPPIRTWTIYRVEIAPDHMKKLKKRLAMTGIAHRLDKRGQDIFLSMPNYYTIEDVQDILRVRPLRIYGVTQDKLSASRMVYILDNKAQPLYLTGVLYDEHDIKSADIKFDGASRPCLVLKLRDKRTFDSMIAFEIDSVIVGTAVLDTLKKIDTITMHSDMSFYELQLLEAYILQPLPEVELSLEGEGVE